MNNGNAETITTKQLYDEIVKNRKELKNSIKASEANVLLKIESLNNKIKILEKENIDLKNKVEILERDSRKNNLIIFGLDINYKEVSVKSICNRLKQLLGIDLSETDINNIYPLGKVDNSPIKLELVSQLRKREILQNCNKLKGSKIFIAHDLTENQRSEYKILRAHLNQAKENTDNRCFIKGNRLYVNNIAYTVDDLQYEPDPKAKNNSAPPTPDIWPSQSIETEIVPNQLETQKPCTIPEEKKIELSTYPVTEEKQSKRTTAEVETTPTNLEEIHTTPKSGAGKIINKPTAAPLNRDILRSRLRSCK